jgi:outer membrane protein assembly factor BamE (lipoprotein component of BamABCDE complex)
MGCFLLLTVFACNKPLPRLETLDMKAWQEDTDGCSGYRANQQMALQNELAKLKGLSQMQIVNVLGKPDQNELYKRNQKFFYYWLSGSPVCADKQAAKRLSVRFNAMGYAKEVLIE